jgi:hypothetical protein
MAQPLKLDDQPALEGSRALGTSATGASIIWLTTIKSVGEFGGTWKFSCKSAQTLNQPQTFTLGFIRSWCSLPQWSTIAEKPFVLEDFNYQLGRACLSLSSRLHCRAPARVSE